MASYPGLLPEVYNSPELNLTNNNCHADNTPVPTLRYLPTLILENRKKKFNVLTVILDFNSFKNMHAKLSVFQNFETREYKNLLGGNI